jgi:D-3-phosphoglycerate dehydrogenase
MTFTVGITQNLKRPDGAPRLPASVLALLQDEQLEWGFVGGPGELGSQHLAACDALVTFGDPVSARTLRTATRLAILACPGIDLDRLDLEECTRLGIALSTTRGGVRRPVASAAVAFLHAVAFRLADQDRAAREPGWPRRLDSLGIGLTGRTLGVIAPAHTVREISRLVEPLGMRLIAYDPSPRPATAAAVAAGAADLDSLLSESDFVCVACPCDERTRHLVDATRLARMRPSAYLIGVHAAGVVDESALAAAIAGNSLAGAALDSFESEPLPTDHPLLPLERVLLAPNALAYAGDSLASCFMSIRDVARGKPPAHLANPQVLDDPIFRRKLASYTH